MNKFIRFFRWFTCIPIASILSVIIIGAIFKESKNYEYQLRELIGSFVWFTSVNLISPALKNKKEQFVLISFFSLLLLIHSLFGLFSLGYYAIYYYLMIYFSIF